MKPSNTGIDWLFQSLNSPTLGAELSMQLWAKDRVLVCEWAAQIAIAEYRKELAAKVGAVRRYDYVSYGGDYELELNAEGDYANVHDVLSLLNENDEWRNT